MLDYLNGNDNKWVSLQNPMPGAMELFTMGENIGYTQNDVVEAAGR
ncbi:MAG: DUF1800 family protein [Saprospiraceae bacterium]|nr:DUF1800 family protein [Saprospiraceae bacterium]